MQFFLVCIKNLLFKKYDAIIITVIKGIKKKLKDISTLQMGYSFREAIKNNEDGSIFVISAKDVRNNFVITNKGLKKIDTLLSIKTRLIKKDDVILSNRMYFSASIVKIDKKTIASSSVYILKPNKEIILPEYLALWINSQEGQSVLDRNSTGMTIKTILKTNLENIEIEIPDLNNQQKIIELNRTKNILIEKIKQKEKILNNIFQGTLTEIINKK